MYDLIIRGGTVVDGSGSAGFVGDVAVAGDRIATVGTVTGPAKREIDATGLIVSPGFVDVHTHYDAQVFWDPQLSPSCFHGVTTAIGGNCGFSIAPLSPEAATYLLPMLAKVEGMPVKALETGVPWNWRSFADYLGALEGKVGLNIGFLAGHSAIRRVVMGERAVGEKATPEELSAMKALLAQCLADGALGFSSTNAVPHTDAAGRPVPSRHASREEIVELAGVCRDFEGTSLEFIPGVGTFSEAEQTLMADMSAAAQRTLNWNVLAASDDETRIRTQLLASEIARERGGEVIALTTAQPMTMRLNLLSGVIFESLAGWGHVFAMPVAERIAYLSNPANRRELDMRGRSSDSGPFQFIAHWENLTVSISRDADLVGRRVGDIARERGLEPIDAMLDIAIADDLTTNFLVEGQGADDATWAQRGEFWLDERTVIGASDAGAHLDMIDQFTFATVVLGEGVRERRLLSIEQAVHQLTQVPAELIGLRQRGLIEPGWFADITIFDADIVGVGPIHTRNDLPAGEMRLYADAIGIKHVIVNGVEIVADGRHTGVLPGKIIRSGADTATREFSVPLAAE